MALFVTWRRPLKNWVPGLSSRQQPLWDEHAEVIDRLFEAGKIVLGGPFTDNTGALVIVQVENEQEARTIFDDDPWVTEEIMDGGEVKPFQVFINSLDRTI